MTPLSDPLPIETGRRRGRAEAPPSKSVTNRALLLAASATGSSTLRGASDSDDSRRLIEALRLLGARIEWATRDTLRVSPMAHESRPTETISIDVGAAGTTARFLLPLLARRPGVFRLDGVARLRDRPMADLIMALRSLGAEISCLGREGSLPVEIRGGSLRGGRVKLDASISSQFLSALLLQGAFLEAGLEVELQGPLASPSYVRLTTSSLASFGIELVEDGPMFRVAAGCPRGQELHLEGDFSGASYLIAAAALGGGPIRIAGLVRDSVQGDVRLLDWMSRMGARATWDEGELVVSSDSNLTSIDVDATEAPDAVPSLAVVAAFAEGESRISGAATLRVKESDRIAALVSEIRAIGGEAEERDDGLVIRGASRALRARRDRVTVRTHDDHRLAMSFAVAGSVRPGLSIENPTCVSKSFPNFWSVFESLRATS